MLNPVLPKLFMLLLVQEEDQGAPADNIQLCDCPPPVSSQVGNEIHEGKSWTSIAQLGEC